MPKNKEKKPVPRTPSDEEKRLEASAVERLRRIGQSKGYSRLSSRVATSVFRQYRKQMTNKERRNKVYYTMAGLLTWGLKRAPGGVYYIYSEDITAVVRDTYPGGDEDTFINSNKRPEKQVDVEDLFEDKS